MLVLAAAILTPVAQARIQPTRSNPLLAQWTGPRGGVPPFDKVKVEDFKPALEAAMEENLREIEAIAGNLAEPTFYNTIVAMERAGQALRRVRPIYNVWSVSVGGAEFQAVQREMEPRIAAFRDKIAQNPKLFKRIESIYTSRSVARLTAEQQRLTWHYHTEFVLRGAKLGAAQKIRISEINQRLASLYTQFSQNQLADEQRYALVIDREADLGGLPPSQSESAAAEAERRGMRGKWVIANTRSSMEPFLTYSSNRSLREKGWQMWIRRGDNGDTSDNNKLVTEILRLRAERSNLLGHATFAHWRLANTMAKDPRNAMDLMLRIWKPAVEQVRRDVANLQAVVDADGGGFKIQAWDYRYYAEKVRKAKYDVDLNDVKPYLQLESLREAMFWVAGRLYGFGFVQVKDAPVFHDSMSVYEVLGRDGRRVGLWYFDPYARPGKDSGAWMRSYRAQQNLDGPITAIVSNNANFIQGPPGKPVLISWDDAETLFHEFGHALHGLNSNVVYPSLSGTSTLLDFGEFPAQLNEHWLQTPEVLRLLVDQNGQALPSELVDRIKRARTFNKGFTTTEFLASAIVDMKLHLDGDAAVDPRAFEKTTLDALAMPSEIAMRHRIPHFGHVFSAEHYAAGYYAYLWAEVLEHDAFEAFMEAGGPYDQRLAKRLRDTIMSVGNSVDPAQAFRNFRGRDPKIDALLRSSGFPVMHPTGSPPIAAKPD